MRKASDRCPKGEMQCTVHGEMDSKMLHFKMEAKCSEMDNSSQMHLGAFQSGNAHKKHKRDKPYEALEKSGWM